MILKKISYIFAPLLALLVSACGGDIKFIDANETTTIDGFEKAFFIDSAVEGLTYKTDSIESTTQSDGGFFYKKSDPLVTFYVGAIKIADFNLSNLHIDRKVLPIDLVSDTNPKRERADTISTKLTKILLVLQSLDNDFNASNGIKIEQETSELFQDPLDILDENLSISEINSTFISVGKSLISSSQALNHYLTTLRAINLLNRDKNDPVFRNSDTVYVDENQRKAVTIDLYDESNIVLTLHSDDFIWDGNSTSIVFRNPPDFELKSSYTLEVVATDEYNNSTTQKIKVYINDLDDTPPTFHNSNFVEIYEGQSQIIELNATDNNSRSLRYKLSPESSDTFKISGSIVSFKITTDYEVKSNYRLDVVAIDEHNNSATQSITVTILDLDEVAPLFLTNSPVNILENQVAVTTLQVEDSSTVLYTLEGADANDFLLDATTGVMQLKVAADYEVKNLYKVKVEAVDSRGNSSVKDLTINVKDVDENSPIIKNEATIHIDENSVSVLKIDAEDESAIRYSLEGVDANSFNINTIDGTVALKNLADYESKKEYVFKIVATDSFQNIAKKDILLSINDLDDTPPTFTNGASVTVDENSFYIMQLSANDINDLTYSIEGNETVYVRVDPISGVLEFTTPADYEQKKEYTIVAVATDIYGNRSQMNISVAIHNLDDTAPILLNSMPIYFEEKNSGSFTLQGSDADGIGNIYYAIEGEDAQSFTLDSSSGVITFNEQPDFEVKTTYMIDILLSDDANNSSRSSVEIFITDVDEVAPIIINESNISVDENQLNVTTIVAKDASNVSYSLSGEDANSFLIDSRSGVLLFRRVPDYEKQSIYRLNVSATDINGNKRSKAFRITIKNLNDTAPHFSNENEVSVDEGTLFIMKILSEDSDNLGAISYSLSGSDSAKIRVNENDELLFTRAPDYESQSQYSVTVIANDGKNKSQLDLNISINNINDNAPTFTSTGVINVDENERIAGKISAIDKDGDRLYYALSGVDAQSFQIGRESGVLEFLSPADYELKENYALTITVGDGVHQLTQSLVVNINNVNDNFPIFSATSISVDENQYDAMTLGVSDADNLLPSTITISGEDADKFDFDGAILRFKAKPDYEKKSSYHFNATADDGDNITTEAITINIVDLDETILYIKKALYSDNNTVDVNDDTLYLYFNKSIDISTIPSDVSSAYKIDGVGAIGSETSSEYNDTFFHQHILSLSSEGTLSLALKAGESNISLDYKTITDSNGSYPVDINITPIEIYKRVKILKAGESELFVDGEEIVINNRSKITWQKSDDGVLRDWNEAESYCKEFEYGELKDWRLPSLKELTELSDKSRVDPAINPIFNNTHSDYYWSATPLSSSSDYGWVVDFRTGKNSWLHKSDYRVYVRCLHSNE